LAKSSKLRVMISSRCNDEFPLRSKDAIRLTDLRVEMKKEIESAETLGSRLYEVWIHEQAGVSAERNSWEECVRQARDCDMFLMLYNGNAGFKGKGELATVGICDAEFQAAFAAAPSKVTVVDIFERGSPAAPSGTHHKAFQERIERENVFGSRPASIQQLKDAIRRSVATRTVELAQKGVLAGRGGRGHLGPALDWRRLGYTERADRMRSAVVSALGGRLDAGTCAIELDGRSILCRPAAIPDSLSVAAAREFVGQPHLRDHADAVRLKKCHGGPVHVIACQRGATESQAQRMLGYPNATVVPAPFGIYVVDPIQAVQFVLIANCSDEHATRLAVQGFLEWLSQAGQLPILVQTARKRKEVVTLLAKNGDTL
jgi:hypothetical protein